jgi:hypothetical protein
MGSFGLPGSHTTAGLSLAATSSGAFTRFETHEPPEASDLPGSRSGHKETPASPWHLTSAQAAHLSTQADRDRV